MYRHASVTLVAAVLVVLCVVGGNRVSAGEAPTAVVVARVPGNGIQPQVAVDTTGTAHVIYFTGDPIKGDVFYVRSTDGGATFSPPIRVNSAPDSAVAIGTIRGPKLAVGKGGRPHVAWMGAQRATPRAPGDAVPMLYARLNDAGDAFEPQRNVITAHPGLDGGGTVAADREGHVWVAWHAPKEKDHAELERRVWVARSDDGGATFGPEQLATDAPTGVCGCCGMAATAGPDGRVRLLFRSADARGQRDMILLTSRTDGASNAWDAPATLAAWKVSTCPMSTSAFASDGATAAAATLAAFETAGHIDLTRLSNDDAPDKTRRLPGAAGQCKHPAVAVNGNGETLVVWAEGTGWQRGGAVAWVRLDRELNVIAGSEGRADGLPAWSRPAAFARPDGTFVVMY
jgi:hypothetical protein